VPLARRLSGTVTRTKPVHSVVSRETASKRTKQAWAETRAEEWAESRAEEWVDSAVEAGIESAVEAPVESAVEAPVESAVESAVEAGIEPPSGARHDPSIEAWAGHMRKTASHVHVLGVKLARSPQGYQKG
jgi:hypothetical protein